MQEKSIDKKLITIVTVNFNTSHFIELMLYSFEKLTKNSYKVIICDNGSKQKDILNLVDIVKKYENVDIVFRQQSSFGSIGHAEAMDLLISKVDTPYFVTMDSDAVFLKKNWDESLINRLTDTIKVIGTTLPPTKDNNKPLDFPLVFAVMYETSTYKKLNPSFMPWDTKQDKSKDTGWQIRELYLENKYSSEVFSAKNTKFSQDTSFGDLYCAVYYLNKNLIASHFGRGSTGGVAKYNNKWWFKIPFISKGIRKYIGNEEKYEWIKKSKGIIDDQ